MDELTVPRQKTQVKDYMPVVSAAVRSCAMLRKDKYIKKAITDSVASNLGLAAGPDA